jgi:hypothetical protein
MSRLRVQGGLLALLLLLATAMPVAAAEPSARERLAEVDLALLDQDFEPVCRNLSALLAPDSDLHEVALYRLARWLDECDPEALRKPVADLAERMPLPADVAWRAFDLARQLFDRTRDDEGTRRYEPLRLAGGARGWNPVSAPNVWTFATVDWPEGDTPGEGLGTGGVAWTRTCFENPEPATVVLRTTWPNAGRARLDGEPIVLVGPDAGRRFPVERNVAVRLHAGRHELRTIQAVTVAAGDVQAEAIPAWTLRTVPCTETAPAGWQAVESRPPRLEDVHLEAWRQLASGQADNGFLRRVAAHALDGPEEYLLYRAALRDDALREPGSDDRERELHASFLSLGTFCLPALDLAAAHLAAGEREPARNALERADEACLRTARGLLLQADLAMWMQWVPVADRFLDEARNRHPQHCPALTAWFERQQERGAPVDVHAFAVRCPAIERAERVARVRRGEEPDLPPPERFVDRFEEGLSAERERWLLHLAAGVEGEPWSGILDELVRRDPQVAWQVADALLAAGRPDLARTFAARARDHRSTWESLRSQAARIFHWRELLPLSADLDETIDGYLDSGFAVESSQVTVLDEAVAMPGDNGWLNLVETTVVHLRSPDAAEGVGEISLAPDEELVELAVRKADGRWFGPSEAAGGAYKETLSLAGLAPGDLVIRRTLRELPLQSGPGGCHALPAFYFTPREYPVFHARYVLARSTDGLEIIHQGDDLDIVREEDGTLRAEAFALEPVAAEPLCPDPEAGLSWLQARAPCFSWDRLRDRIGDALLGYCNQQPAPGPGLSSPDAVYRSVMNRIDEDGSSLLDASQRDIDQAGRGNRVLGLYCALVQAGYDAHLVVAHSPAAANLDWRRPTLAAFDGALVHVAGEKDRWYDPYDRLVAPGYLRPGLRGRPALVLSPRYPRLFVTTPDDAAPEGWNLRLDGELEPSGRLQGELLMVARGDAAVTLDRQARNGTEAAERLAEGILYMILPGARVEKRRYKVHDDRVELRIRFQGQVEIGDAGRIVLRLPPSPSQELVQLARRESSLYYGGVLPTTMDMTLRFDSGLRWEAPVGDERMEDDFMALRMTAERERNTLRIRKFAAAPPQQVRPDRYAEFVQSIVRQHRLRLLTIEVRHDADR